MTGIYWIASYPKSGNTWLRMLLAAATGDVDSFHINQAQAVIGMPFIKRARFDDLIGVEASDLSPDEMIAWRPAMLKAILQEEEKPLIAKTHDARLTWKGTPMIPDEHTLGGVYLVRDPRDVAVSLARHMDVDIDTAIRRMGNRASMMGRSIHHLNRQIAEVWSSWSAHVDSWTLEPAEGVLVLRYEDMRQEPEHWAAKAMQAVGVSVDEATVARAVETTRLERLRQQEEESGFVEAHANRFFGQGRPGGWRDVLTPEQASRLEEDHGEAMRRFRYLP